MASSWLEMMFICAFFSLQQPQRDLISYLTKRWHYTTLRPIRNARSSSWDLRVLEDMSWGWGSLRTQVALRPQYLVSIHLQYYPEKCVFYYYIVSNCTCSIWFSFEIEILNLFDMRSQKSTNYRARLYYLKRREIIWLGMMTQSRNFLIRNNGSLGLYQKDVKGQKKVPKMLFVFLRKKLTLLLNMK